MRVVTEYKVRLDEERSRLMRRELKVLRVDGDTIYVEDSISGGSEAVELAVFPDPIIFPRVGPVVL